MKYFGIVISIFLASPISSQLYIDKSHFLPDDGARGQSMDVKAVDLDLDGDIDIVLANEFQPNTILYNNGQGQFFKADPLILPAVIHDSEDVVAVDLNGDQFPDLAFCSEDDVTIGGIMVHELYLNSGGSFQTTSYNPPDSEANALIDLDLNEDDFPDLFFGNNGPVTCLINNGDGSFIDESSRFPVRNRTTQDLLAIDIDGDRDFDIFEANEDGNILYVNDGDGNFTDESDDRLPQGLDIETRKASLGDVDDDGDDDIFLSNVRFIEGKDPQNRIYINDGDGNFTDESLTRLPVDMDHTIDALFEDVDLDGDLDIFVANVFGARIKVYENDGNGFFSDATDAILGATYVLDALGITSADFDKDGFTDIYICDRNVNSNRKDLILMRKNTSPVSTIEDADQISIYPIPSTDSIQIKLKDENFRKIVIYDLIGSLLHSHHLQSGQSELTIKLKSGLGLTSGTYTLKFIGEVDIVKQVVLL